MISISFRNSRARKGCIGAVPCILALLVSTISGHPILAASSSNGAVNQSGIVNSTIAAAVLEEIKAFKPASSAAQWMRTHPGDTIEKATPYRENPLGGGFDRGHWCLRSRGRSELSAEVVREVYFYPPGMPGGGKLPAGRNLNALAMNGCTAGMLSLTTQDPAPREATSRAAVIETALAKAYEAPQSYLLNIYFLDVAVAAEWKTRELTLIAGYDLPPPHDREIVLAVDPIAGMNQPEPPLLNTFLQNDRNMSIVQRAMKLTHVDESLKQTVLAISEREYSPGTASRVRWSEFVSTVQKWLVATGRLDKTGRAAGLLVADRLVDAELGAIDPPPEDAASHASARDPRVKTREVLDLERLGAKMAYDELGGGYFYFYNWANEAWKLDGDGPAGTLALLVLMDRGFDLSPGMCQSGMEQFRRVIAEGEHFLAKSSDPAVNAPVHFMMGDAWGDIVALATEPGPGAAEELPDPKQYLAEAPKARVEAVAQYRAGLRLDQQSYDAYQAWTKAWRVIAGLPPEQLRYYCVYD